MSKLTEKERSVLSMMNGGPEVPWGAAMSAALEFLKGDGLVEQEGSNYWITEAGIRALEDKGEGR